jgi:hypoxia up-regulated 1
MKIDVYAVHPQTDEQHLATYIIDEIDSIAKNDIAIKEGSTTPKLTLKFELTRSHLLQIEKAEIKIEELVRTEVPQNKTETEETEETAEVVETEEGVEAVEKTSEEEVAPVEVEEVEPVFEEKMVPHNYPLFANETVHGCRLLTKENKKAAKDRIKALEKRDNDKYKTDEAKNTFESLIYEFRSWLNEDENQVYESKEEIERLIEKCNSGEEWLYDAGDEVGYKEYQTKGYDLKGDYSKLRTRKSED